MNNLSVPHPEVKTVLDMTTGRHLSVQEVIGHDYDKVIKLRSTIKQAQQENSPLYVCSLCNVPVNLLMHPESRLFFFRHMVEDGRCPAITKGELSQLEINARKYNGAKESALHSKIKELVVRSLNADNRFQHIEVESTWKGTLTSAYRRPDVRAIYADGNGNTIQIAFEIQLSTTFLDVIVERRQFYLKEGGLLFWIFANFDESNRRLTQDDVFFNNNQNAFIVSEKTCQTSIQNKTFFLECIWAKPGSRNSTSGLHRKNVPFSELTLDLPQQQAYYFDFYGCKKDLHDLEAASKVLLRNKFEMEWIEFVSKNTDLSQSWREFQRAFTVMGIPFPQQTIWFACTTFELPLLSKAWPRDRFWFSKIYPDCPLDCRYLSPIFKIL